jgi:hypothetical protein
LSDTPEDDPQGNIHKEGDAILLESPVDILNRKQRDREEQDDQYKKRQLRITERLAILTGLLVLGNGLSDYLMWKQNEAARITAEAAQVSAVAAINASRQTGNTLREMQKQSESMKTNADASREQAAAAKNAVENAKRSLKTTIDSFRLEQRPWVMPFEFRATSDLEADKVFSVTVSLENTGRTPAIDIVPLSGNIFAGSEPMRPVFSVGGPRVSGGFLSPGNKNFTYTTDAFKPSLSDVAAYLGGRKRIYTFGVIRYRDTFNCRHVTNFCIYHQYGDPLAFFRFCENGNDTKDEEACK